MTKGITKIFSLLFLMTFSEQLAAQAGGSSNYFMYGLLAVVGVIVLGFVLQVADSLLTIEAKQTGADKKSKANFSLFPDFNEIFSPKLPSYAAGNDVKVFTRGHDILLEGAPEKVLDTTRSIQTFAIQPINFVGMSPIPKVEFAVGDEVKAGDVLLYDKKRPEIKYAAPVSGEVIAINRGLKRAITSVVILADKEIQYKKYEGFDLENADREALKIYLLESGVWPMIRQRPYNVVADPTLNPRDIFISTFDTAPLAPNLNFVVEGRGDAFQKGLDVLNKLTDGKVHLGLNAKGTEAPAPAFASATGVEKHWFHGAHPAGNVGVQIHHVDFIAAGETVWTLGVQEVITMGELFLNNRFDARRVVAISGAEFSQNGYVSTYQGANIKDLVKGNLTNDHVRLISGDVLSGQKKEQDSFLNYFDDQLTVVEEGDYYEMFGWLLPLSPRPSVSNTFPNALFGDLKFHADTNSHGEKRAFVVTGQYEKVLPMDVFPQHLMKAILVNDFERIEGLGIYELVEEDVALCEFVCTSKQPLQQILREGLTMMHEQG